jgi:hypothetical protein
MMLKRHGGNEYYGLQACLATLAAADEQKNYRENKQNWCMDWWVMQETKESEMGHRPTLIELYLEWCCKRIISKLFRYGTIMTTSQEMKITHTLQLLGWPIRVLDDLSEYQRPNQVSLITLKAISWNTAVCP